MTQLADAPVPKAASKMKIDPKQAHLANYETFRGTAGGPGWLADLRENAIRAFARNGLPGPKAEAWRWTKHRQVTTGVFSPAVVSHSAAHPVVREYGFSQSAAVELVVVDGVFLPKLSTVKDLPGVEVQSLREAATHGAATLQRHLGRLADVEKNPFVALNTAFLSDGIVIRVGQGVKLEKPIHILFITTGTTAADHPAMACARTLIVAEDGAEFTLVETYAGPEGETYFTNAVTEIIAGEDCVIDHNTLNAESRAAYHVATMEAVIGARTRFYDHACTIGGRMTRNDLNVHLAGEAADATLNGVVLLDGDQHGDNHTLLDHQQPNCPSYELYKHVLDGRASGVFKGQIFVHREAQKTNAVQNSRSLLLSDTATMNSQPALEIYADDVKCTHGSTTGPLDEGAVFYLNSRGVSTDTARRLLTYAFAADVTRRIKVAPVRERVEHYMARQHGLPTDFRIQDLAEATEDVVF